ncbi:MAG: hypothetical protein U0353_17535 [Sandaracinus sp.]
MAPVCGAANRGAELKASAGTAKASWRGGTKWLTTDVRRPLQPATLVRETTATTTVGWPGYVAVPGIVVNPVGRRGMDMPLVVGGGIVAGVGAVAVVIGSAVVIGAAGCTACQSQRHAGEIILGLGAPVFVVGLLPFLIGVAGYTYDLVPTETSTAQVRLRWLASALGADAGASLVVEY